jgi:putative ATP-dependent endonuclease of the OLD family
MKIAKIKIDNFRGVKSAEIYLPDQCVLVGDNNTGKTSILEALDLVLGPDRLNRRVVVDEHDFFDGNYFSIPAADPAERDEGVVVVPSPKIEIEVSVVDLNEEQSRHFNDQIEFWDTVSNTLYIEAEPAGVDADNVVPVLRVKFVGWYDPDEDDFEGKSYYARSLEDGNEEVIFHRTDKRHCGFLYLRSVRTGSRALSLERGSLLDIILRIKEVRPQMWEQTISKLEELSVADAPELGISPILESINKALKKYVPREWGTGPQLKVSSLTREDLRKVIKPFITTGDGQHSAPFYRQGTGTINILVLAMLSQIAEDKQNTIFAMEEPETAIPPHTQKRIIHEVQKLASQAIFTSHSPYVLEEFTPEQTVCLSRDTNGVMAQSNIVLPANVKAKRYRQEFRTRFCEGLLSRRILVAEGATEAAAFPAVCRRLHELNPDKYTTLEGLGVCIIDAYGESNISGMAAMYKNLSKDVYALCDKQAAGAEAAIVAETDMLYMHDYDNFESLILQNTTEAALQRFAAALNWPPHFIQTYVDPVANYEAALPEYFKKNKANWAMADFLYQCTEAEIPEWLRNVAIDLKNKIEPVIDDIEDSANEASVE